MKTEFNLKNSVGVYIIRCNDGGEQPLKVGVTGRLKVRLAGIQTGNPHKLTVARFIPCESSLLAYELESYLHTSLRDKRMRGEWFSVCEERIVKLIVLFANKIRKQENKKQRELNKKQREINKKQIEENKKQRKENKIKKEAQKMMKIEGNKKQKELKVQKEKEKIENKYKARCGHSNFTVVLDEVITDECDHNLFNALCLNQSGFGLVNNINQ